MSFLGTTPAFLCGYWGIPQ